MKLVTLTLLAVLLASPTALAQDNGIVQVGGWTILPFSKTSCTAYNRDIEEINESPYTAMSLRRKADGQSVSVTALFWPGAVVPGEKIMLYLILNDQRTIYVLGSTMDTYGVMTSEVMAPELLNEMAASEFVSITSPDIDGAVSFEMKDFAAALDALADCAKAL